MPSSARGRAWAPAPTAPGAPHLRGPRANPAKRFAWGKGGPAAGMSVRARPEASDPKLGLTLSRCGGCATVSKPLRLCKPACGPFGPSGPFAPLWVLPACAPRLRASCHAAAAARRTTAQHSAKNAVGVPPTCFFICVFRCRPAPHASALLLTFGCRAWR